MARLRLVDEMEILVPTLLGNGERLFEGTGDDLHGLEMVRTVATPRVILSSSRARSMGRSSPGDPRG